MTDGAADADRADVPPRRRWPFRTWEVVVITIAILLFVAAAFAGPREQPPQGAAPTGRPTASPAGPSATPLETPTVTAVVPRDEHGRAGHPVATVDQVLTEAVGDYVLANRGLSDAGARGGALQAEELRYSQQPPDSDTDVFHGIEVHLDGDAARQRVRTFGDELGSSGFRITKQQPLRSPAGVVQGLFLELRSGQQRLLLWSNRNVVFSLGGGPQADLDSFYEALPY